MGIFGEVLILPVAILLVFYLYLLAHQEKVQRPLFFFIGVLAVAACLLFSFFLLDVGARPGDDVKVQAWNPAKDKMQDSYRGTQSLTWFRVIYRLLTTIAVTVGFVAGVIACWGGQMPVEVPGLSSAKPTPPKADVPTESPAP